MPATAKNYAGLYALQDEVLNSLSGHFGPFYLSGGAALSRYYLNHRFAYDLDLSVNLLPCFSRKAAHVVDLLKTQFPVSDDNVDVFTRTIHLWIQGRDKLKISLANDISEQWGFPVMAGRVPVDNMKNMLVKKLKTILERDDPKDLFDIISIASAYSFHWGEILKHAQKKAIMAEVNLFLKLHRAILRFNAVRGGGEPKNVFNLLGIPPPIIFDQKYLSVHIEQNGLIPGQDPLISPVNFSNDPGEGKGGKKTCTNLKELALELRRTAAKLKALPEQHDFTEATEQQGIPSSFDLNMGMAAISIRSALISVKEMAVKRLNALPGELYEDKEWMNKPACANELEEKFSLIRDDLSRAGENSLGAGKTPIEEARPLL